MLELGDICTSSQSKASCRPSQVSSVLPTPAGAPNERLRPTHGAIRAAPKHDTQKNALLMAKPHTPSRPHWIAQHPHAAEDSLQAHSSECSTKDGGESLTCACQWLQVAKASPRKGGNTHKKSCSSFRVLTRVTFLPSSVTPKIGAPLIIAETAPR